MVVFAAALCCERRRSRVSGGRLLRTDTATGHGESPQGTAEVLAVRRFLLLAPTRRLQFFALVEHGTLVWIAWLAWMVNSPRLLMSIPSLASLYMAARIAASLFEPRNFVEEWSAGSILTFPTSRHPAAWR